MESMETDGVVQQTEQPSKKHKVNKSNEITQNGSNAKRFKHFSSKEFRKKLSQDNISAALNEFLHAISVSNGHDYVFEYLENGGNCLELLHCLETDSNLSPVLVFELVAHVLLKITASGPQYHAAGFEACRYILNNYKTVINKMIGLNSTSRERKVCLKLLTAMVAFSSSLAKDILLNINFYSANIELLTKNTGEESSVRDHFIHFLTAFLIDGYYQSLSILLEKKGFITSIIKGLQFDVADTVCVVISAMKNHILENPSVSKTAKMKVFNTLVVRDIVNLYNWKGPAALKAQTKKNAMPAPVDQYSKSKVNQCVHDFLIVLCTSHRYGVIFRDHSLGLGKKHQNALMYTVLESLERPWNHSYACELVIKICSACPDLTKTTWQNLKSSLEPRLTQMWLSAMKFAKMLLAELKPTCIEFCARELSIPQLAQAIQILVAPLPILKEVIPENDVFPNSTVKRHVITLLREMLTCLNSYLETAKDWLNIENHGKLKTLITSYVTKHFLDANSILSDWEAENVDCDIQSAIISNETFLEVVFDIFDFYSKLAPELLDSLNSTSFQLMHFLEKLSYNDDEESISAILQVKVINIFIDLEPTNFSPNAELFSFVLPLLLKCYYETFDRNALKVLNKLLRYTGVFEGCYQEINIWINGILHLRQFKNHVVQDLIKILRMSTENIMEYSEELSLLNPESDIDGNIEKILEKLKNTDISLEEESVVIKHRYFSPMVLGLVNYLKGAHVSNSLNAYSKFVLYNLCHLQTHMQTLVKFAHKYEVIPNGVKEYILSWAEKGDITYFKLSGRIQIFATFTMEFFSEDIENFLKNSDLNIYPDLPLNLLHACIFYLSNLVYYSTLDNACENCLKLIEHLIEEKLFQEDYIETVLAHPILSDNFSFEDFERNALSKFILYVIHTLQDSGFDISRYSKVYRNKLFRTILKILKKPKKYVFASFMRVLKLFQLSYEQCCKILRIFSYSEGHVYYTIILDILSYCVTRVTSLYETEDNIEPFEEEVIENLTTYFVVQCKSKDTNVYQLSQALHGYFKVFPCQIIYINPKLVSSLMNVSEYNKENVALMVFLLERHIDFFEIIEDNLGDLCSKKGILLPVLKVLVSKEIDDNALEEIYRQFQMSLTKALLKPQKASQHFHGAYEGLITLVQKFMPLDHCKTFTEKVQKFEVTEVFHVKLLEIVFNKVMENKITTKALNNIILTYVHLQMQVFKKNVKDNDNVIDFLKLNDVAESFNSFLTKNRSRIIGIDLKPTCGNETFKAYITYCLKFGISGQDVLLKSLNNLIRILAASMEKDDAKVIMDMLLCHSNFLDVMLNEHSSVKFQILSLFLFLCQTWNEFMERFHVPMLLASYRAMVSGCDRIIWMLLRMYDENSRQTHFQDFKPFLWGRAAASHYSVRQSMESSLWRQPKMRDVLETLEEEYVLSTITNYPLKGNLNLGVEDIGEIENGKSYDLKFLLPLFSQILAPEQQVQTYTFTRSGALSLTVVALGSEEQKMREAACHVLGRYHYHVDASQHGKDNLLWIRYVEVVCKAIAMQRDKKLNNFSCIYLARMALILTRPNHVMYVPLSQHLTAKSSLDFGTIPELYTFLHSSEVNYKDHRRFILELLKDGMRTDQDFTSFQRSMAHKLFSELFNSSLADLDTKSMILDVICAACKLPLGVAILCQNNSLLTQVYQIMRSFLMLPLKEKLEAKTCISKVIRILLEIARRLEDSHSRFMTFNAALQAVKDDVFSVLSDDDRRMIFEIFYLGRKECTVLLTDDVVEVLLKKSNDKFCTYVIKYGSDFIDVGGLSPNDVFYYLRLLIVDKRKS